MGRLNNLKKNPKLLFFITEDWAFCSHRFALAKFALKKGFDVVVITRVREHGSIIEQAGMKVIPLEIKRDGLNPLIEMKIIGQFNFEMQHLKSNAVACSNGLIVDIECTLSAI